MFGLIFNLSEKPIIFSYYKYGPCTVTLNNTQPKFIKWLLSPTAKQTNLKYQTNLIHVDSKC